MKSRFLAIKRAPRCNIFLIPLEFDELHSVFMCSTVLTHSFEDIYDYGNNITKNPTVVMFQEGVPSWALSEGTIITTSQGVFQ